MLERISLALSIAAFGFGCGNSHDAATPDSSVQADAAKTPDAAVNASFEAIPLSADGGGYTAKFTIGGQAFDVIVDTGSTSAGIAATTCTNCGVHPEYAPGTATDLHQTASSQYGSGSWKGEIFEDAATMGGEPSVALDFASITSQTGFFDGSSFQGILGLGPDGLLLPHTTSYLTKLIASGMKGQLAFQLCPDGGTMWLGGYDAAAATAAPAFTPINTAAPYYLVGVGNATVVGSASLTSADFGPTIIDTGTTLTYVPVAVVNAVIAGVKGSSGYSAVFGTQDLTDGSCLNTTMTSAQIDAMLPALSLSFAGATTPIELPATRSYLFDQGSGQYCFTFSDSSQLFGGQKVSLFGNTLLAGMLTVFDIANQQIGFAAQTGCPEANFAKRPMIVRKPTIDPAAIMHQLQ
jgi:hypothetical protein